MSEIIDETKQTEKKKLFPTIGAFLKKHIKLIIVLVIIIALIIFIKIKVDKAAKEIKSAVNEVPTSTVEKMDLQSTVSVTGTLEPIEKASVTSTVSGKKVDKIMFEEGDFVEAGSTVVTFTSGDDDYEKKLAELDAKYALADVKNNRKLVDDSQAITDTQKEIDDLQEDMQEIRDYLSDNEDIYTNLCDARDEWIYAQKNYASDSNPYLKAKERYDAQITAAMVFEDPVSIEIYEKKQDELEDDEEKLTDLQVKLDTANYNLEYDQLQQEYDNKYTKSNEYEQYDSEKVIAPISGYITSIDVTEGNNYAQGSTVFTISDTSDFIVEASVDEYDISKIQKDQKCVIKFDATEDDEFEGVVTYVAVAPGSSISTSSSTNSSAAGMGMAGMTSSGTSQTTSDYAVKISLSDKDDRLRVGMTAKASVIRDSKKDCLSVIYDCVEEDADGNTFITQIDKDNNETKIPVELGMESDFYVEVIGKDVKEGMTIKATPASDGKSDFERMMDSMSGGPEGH